MKNSGSEAARSIASQLVDWLEPQLERSDYRKILLAPFGLLGILGAAGAFALPGAWAFIPVFLVVVWLLLGVVLVDFARRRVVRDRKALTVKTKSLRQRSINLSKALATIQRRNPDYFYVESCHDHMTVRGDGHTKIVRDVQIVGGPASTEFFFTGMFSNSDTDRSEVSVTVWNLKPDGTRSTRRSKETYDTAWPEPNKLWVFVYFDTPLGPGDLAGLRVEVKWPKYSALLVSGEPEDQEWSFQRRNKVFDYTLSLAPECGIKPTAAIRSFGDLGTLDMERDDATGQVTITFSDTDLQPGDRRGFQFDPDPG